MHICKNASNIFVKKWFKKYFSNKNIFKKVKKTKIKYLQIFMVFEILIYVSQQIIFFDIKISSEWNKYRQTILHWKLILSMKHNILFSKLNIQKI